MMSAVERVLPHEDLFRAAFPAVEMRGAEDARPVCHGHFLVFNVWTEIKSRYEGHFLERFAPGSVKRTLNMKKGFIPPLLEHGQDPSVWKKPLGDVLLLEEDEKGAYYEVELFDTQYVKEILPALKSGMYGASFRFSSVHEDYDPRPGKSVWNPQGLPERTVLEAGVAEFSLVLFPAYRQATAGLRSLTDYYNPDAIQMAIDEYRDASEHMEGVSLFLEERSHRLAEAPEADPEGAEADDDEDETLPPAAALVPQLIEAGFSAESVAEALAESDFSKLVHTGLWSFQLPTLESMTSSTSAANGGSVNVTSNVQTRTFVGEVEKPSAERTAPDEPVARTDEQRFREQRIERLYKRSYQVLGESIWAVHPGMLEVYLNVMAERRAGYRPSQDEIDERISQRGVRAQAMPYDEEMAGDVAVIDICGSIMPHGGAMSNASSRGCNIDDLSADFQTALKDDNVKAIMFNIDSPGGSVDLVPEFAQSILDARGQKPIVAMVNTMAASAAYWIACACEKMYVTPSGEVGSIGVYSCHSDLSGKLAQEGVKKTFVSAGKYKTEGNPYEPLSAEAEADMQSKVDTYYGMFVAGVAAGRGTDTKTVEAKFGQGRMVLADEAVSLGMADAVLTIDEALLTLDPTAELPDEEPDEDEEAPIAPTDNEPEPDDDDPTAHLGSEAREPSVDVNDEQKEKPRWLI